MDCKKVREELVFLFVDGEIAHELLSDYREHVAHCPHCARRARTARCLLAVIRRQTLRCQAPNHLRERILATMPHRRGSVRP